MSEPFEPKRISLDSIPRALQRVERYRLLNEPEQAESICLDILEVDPTNQEAIVMLILALTDQFGRGGASSSARRPRDYVAQLADEYNRNYYAGIIREREARSHLRRGMAQASAYGALREAMDWFDKAAAIRPPGDDDALLRWNACVRTIRRANLQPRPDEPELQLE
jgi:tetratricopeptide (TPR) repeat protein